MDSRSRRIALLVLCAVMGIIKAQEVPVEDEYLRRLNVYETIQSVGDAPFGERLNLNTGDLIFSLTDVPLLGNGPAIALVRPFTTSAEERLRPRALWDWLLPIPRMEAVVGANPMSGGPGQPGDRWITFIFEFQSMQPLWRT